MTWVVSPIHRTGSWRGNGTIRLTDPKCKEKTGGYSQNRETIVFNRNKQR